MRDVATASDARAVYAIMRRVSAGADLPTVLEAITDGVMRSTGFEIVSISLLNRDLELETAAVAGPDSVQARLGGLRVPLADIEHELLVAEPVGQLLLASRQREDGAGPGHGTAWDPGADWARGAAAEDGRWRPGDALHAPLRTPEGELLGLLSVDAPADGRRPDRERRETLEMYAGLAGMALSNARYAEELEDRLRLAAAVEAIHTAASKEQDVSAILSSAAEPVAFALTADTLTLRIFDAEDGTGGDAPGGQSVRWPDGGTTPHDVVDVVSRNAQLAWRNRCVETARVRDRDELARPRRQTQAQTRLLPTAPSEVSASRTPLEGVPHVPVAGGAAGWVRRFGEATPAASDAEQARLLEFLEPSGSSAVLLAPIGAGADCLGYLVAMRRKDEEWTPYEVEAAAQAARHLGQAVLNARVIARERAVVEQLDALDRYTGELITTVSHELRTPLTSIKGHLEIIEDDPEHAPAESYAVIDRNLERMQGLINDLLTLHKLSEDTPLDRSSVVDLAQVARDAVAALRLRADEKGLSLTLTAPPGPLLIGGDRDELERVALNLISNAITYTPAGGSVRVECQRSDRFVRLIVSDNGIGISKADQEELFTDFYRTNNPEALTMPGTGLGLSIVRRIVQRHTGSIRLESDTGQGAAFTVRLPVSHV